MYHKDNEKEKMYQKEEKFFLKKEASLLKVYRKDTQGTKLP